MRAFLILVLVLVAMIFMGWLHFRGDSNSASVTLDTQEIRDDTGKAAKGVRDFVDQNLPPRPAQTTDVPL